MRSILAVGIFIYIFFSSCNLNNVIEDESIKPILEKENLNGTFGLYNNGSGKFTIYNLARFKDTAFLPASTFKIVNSLIGIQTGRVRDDSAMIPWDGIPREIPNWNRDLTMKEAFRYSSVPWYQELARRIGKDTMQKWLDTLHYGASAGRAVIGKIDTFWLDNSLKITADEQLGLMKRLYFNQLPFHKRSMEIVKGMMLQEDSSLYKLSYKSGWGHTQKGNSLGWIVGWIEENNHPYFFAFQVESGDPRYDMSQVRLKLLKQILRQYGFLEGKK